MTEIVLNASLNSNQPNNQLEDMYCFSRAANRMLTVTVIKLIM